jgi:hypothetical protein
MAGESTPFKCRQFVLNQFSPKLSDSSGRAGLPVARHRFCPCSSWADLLDAIPQPQSWVIGA